MICIDLQNFIQIEPALRSYDFISFFKMAAMALHLQICFRRRV